MTSSFVNTKSDRGLVTDRVKHVTGRLVWMKRSWVQPAVSRSFLWRSVRQFGNPYLNISTPGDAVRLNFRKVSVHSTACQSQINRCRIVGRQVLYARPTACAVHVVERTNCMLEASRSPWILYLFFLMQCQSPELVVGTRSTLNESYAGTFYGG